LIEECISDAADLSRSRNARLRGRPNALSEQFIGMLEPMA
jgi:hypothetical protein